MRRPGPGPIAALREVLTGAAIRTIAGIVDMGEAFLAKAHNADGGDLVDTGDDNDDFWVHYVDELTGHAGIARLFVPGNILFARPVDNDTVMIVRGRDAHGPGNAYMVHGDAGIADRVPDWATASSDDDVKDGLYTKRVLRLESKDNGIEINVNTDNKAVTITTGNASVTVNKDGDIVANANGSKITIANNSDVTIVPGSGSVVSLGDTSSNTFFMAKDGEKLVQMVNDLKEQLNNTINDVNQMTVVGEADLIGVPLTDAEPVMDDDLEVSETVKNK